MAIQGQALLMAMEATGSFELQKILEASDNSVRNTIASQFRGHVCECVESPHANHVLQRLIELMPPSSVSFVLDEIAEKWKPSYVARHKFGCRVLERIIEHFPACPGTGLALSRFLDGLLQNALSHFFHSFSTFVVQHILEHGSIEQQKAVVDCLKQDLWKVGLDVHASGVLNKALSYAAPDEQHALVSAILENDGLLARMAIGKKPAASKMLRVADHHQLQEAQRQLSGDAEKLSRCKGGRSLLNKLMTVEGGDVTNDEEEELIAPQIIFMESTPVASTMTQQAPQQEAMYFPSITFSQETVLQYPSMYSCGYSSWGCAAPFHQ